MTVEENLELGAFAARARAAQRARASSACFALFPVLARAPRASWCAALSGGQQQMLAIGRALMARRAC